MKAIKVVHFGAGNIGRGLIVPLFFENEIDIVLVDKNLNLVNQINQKNKYNVKNLSDEILYKIENIKAIQIDENQLFNQLADADFITTSIGSNNLKYLIDKLTKHFLNSNKKQTIICFENGYKISSQFKKMFNSKITQNINFVDVVVDKIISNQNLNNNLNVKGENFFEVVFDQNNWPSSIDKLKKCIYTDNLDAYVNKKLILVNLLHSCLGYQGFNKKIIYTYQVQSNAEIMTLTNDIFKKLIIALNKEFKELSLLELNKYYQVSLKRIFDLNLRDNNERLTRNPILKLSSTERFALAYKLLKKHNFSVNDLLKIIAHVIIYNNLNDQQSQQLQEYINDTNKIEEFLKNNTLFENLDIKLIVKYIKELRHETQK
ncbi:mannitol-1-phosphate 5-dehydrogenase [Mycoplasmopsis cricetuli]|uniref:mannitol-1-phosphate 5-dehydrogenase n=1 Tax=Mycoplasmopsis cricetuli TaxID=171283 RepID=UPI000564FAFB|nr:mannitol-1-phosphate 5-dehydrogenase [Mycoplasmopsis cricetuli]